MLHVGMPHGCLRSCLGGSETSTRSLLWEGCARSARWVANALAERVYVSTTLRVQDSPVGRSRPTNSPFGTFLAGGILSRSYTFFTCVRACVRACEGV